jgi:hypothetical protein
MTYEEAKQEALDAMNDFPDRVKVTNYEGDGREFVELSYTDQDHRIKSDYAGFRWDMLIDDQTVEYRQFYLDLKMKPVKASPRKIQTKRLKRGELYGFIEDQIRLANL